MTDLPPLIVLPCSPALVPELAPGDVVSAEMRAVAVGLLQRVGKSPVGGVSVVCSRTHQWRTSHPGSLSAWGGTMVGLGEAEYLCDLLAVYVLQNAGLSGSLTVRTASTLQDAATQHSDLIIYFADGPVGLGERAPRYNVPTAPARFDWCLAILRGVRVPAATREQLLDDAILEPDVWQTLQRCSVNSGSVLWHSGEQGIGRIVACWEDWSL